MSEPPVVVAPVIAAPKPPVAHEAHHEELGFWRKYVFSTDHKVIGIQYAITGLLFLLFGFSLMMLMRWQLAYPETALPLLGFLGEASMPGGTMLPEFYNSLGAMHGTIMVFLGVVPLAVGGFGNFVLPLQIGAPDMAFPKINMVSYWCLFLGGVIMVASFFVPGGAANSGWTSYVPLANIATTGQTWWLIGMIFLITSSLLGAINFITTTIQIRAKGLTFMRFPFFVWTQFVTAFLLLLAFPPLDRGPLIDRIERRVLSEKGYAVPARAGDGGAQAIVACGRPLPGHQVRIVDAGGRELPERHVGRLQFMGPSSTSGYFRNADATRDLFQEEWLNSGDLAYVAAGDIYITGRAKDVIIKAGRNIYPAEFEEAIGEICGIIHDHGGQVYFDGANLNVETIVEQIAVPCAVNLFLSDHPDGHIVLGINRAHLNGFHIPVRVGDVLVKLEFLVRFRFPRQSRSVPALFLW